VALDYAALLHNLQYCAIGHTSYKNINKFLLIAGIDYEDVDQRNWLSIPGHGANQI